MQKKNYTLIENGVYRVEYRSKKNLKKIDVGEFFVCSVVIIKYSEDCSQLLHGIVYKFYLHDYKTFHIITMKVVLVMLKGLKEKLKQKYTALALFFPQMFLVRISLTAHLVNDFSFDKVAESSDRIFFFI